MVTEHAHAARTLGPVAVIGGAGHVGSALVPRLLEAGYPVRVLDAFWYGQDGLPDPAQAPGLSLHALDVRDGDAVRIALEGADAVIHLACVSNDASFDLDPAFSRAVNLDAFGPVVTAAETVGVRRFIFASSSSVYGSRSEGDVTEDTPTEPMTGYSACKLECEGILLGSTSAMERVVLRPATVCGYAPRMRFDLTVNLLTMHALVNDRIRIYGGQQFRPHLHIQDMVQAYLDTLAAPARVVDRQVFNVGFQNRTVEEVAFLIRDCLAPRPTEVIHDPHPDIRSYRVNGSKFQKVLGFSPRHTVEDAVRDVAAAAARTPFPDPLNNPRYHNVRRMQELLAAWGIHAHRD